MVVHLLWFPERKQNLPPPLPPWKIGPVGIRVRQRCKGAMCSGTSDPNLSPTKWPLKQGQAINFFNFQKLNKIISDFQSSFTVFTIFFHETKWFLVLIFYTVFVLSIFIVPQASINSPTSFTVRHHLQSGIRDVSWRPWRPLPYAAGVREEWKLGWD